MEPSKPSETGRVLGVVRVSAKALGLVLVFTLAAGGGAILHLGLSAPRRFAARQLNAILASTFKGTIIIQKVDVLRLTRVDGVDGEVRDPEGRTVLVLRGLRARFSTMTTLRSLVGRGPLVVRIPELTINGVEVVLEDNAAGQIGLSRAFDQRDPSTGGSGTDLSISIRHDHPYLGARTPRGGAGRRR